MTNFGHILRVQYGILLVADAQGMSYKQESDFLSEHPGSLPHMELDTTRMTDQESQQRLAEELLNQVDAIIRATEEQTRPLEMDPARGELFELFVQANAAGITAEDALVDLSADGLCAALSERWGLKQAAQASAQQQSQLPKEHIARMRSLWSVMRMWMEWTYAWQRWPEFHRS